MRAVCWQGIAEVGVETVPDPEILNPRDAIIKVTSTAICGSDLHLYDGYVPTMYRGDILGHEFMGEVVDVGPGVTNLSIGDRVVVPFPISCGNCYFCEKELYRGNLRVFAHHGRLCRRPSRVRACAFRGCRPVESA
jgi:threonine dehydrogenase-like Zn-dependent dehydrogenase